MRDRWLGRGRGIYARVVESHNENRYGIPISCTCLRGRRDRRQSAFLRRRMKITTPNKTAMTPAIRRIVVESINVISFLLLIGQLHAFNHRY